MSYLVLARRFRPQTFDELIGQPGVTQTLRNAIASGRIAHAYLFCGPRGTGKTSAARILAKCLNCTQGPTPEPCQTCDICERIASGDDLDVIEMDAASHTGVDTIRELRENAQYATGRARFKIYIIDEVHMLTLPAFNALLKTLEEPPPHVKFIFATTEPQKLPETVRSRCQRFDFRPLGAGEIAQILQGVCRREEVSATEDALAAIARHARGSVRDALSLLDQLISYAGETEEFTAALVRELTGAVEEEALLAILDGAVRGEPAAVMQALCEVLDAGFDPAELADALIERLREVLLVATCGSESRRVALSADQLQFARRLADELGLEKILYAIRLLSDARRESRSASHPRIPLELALLRLARTGDLADLGKLAGQVAALVEGKAVPAGGGHGRAPSIHIQKTTRATALAQSQSQYKKPGKREASPVRLAGASSVSALSHEKTLKLTTRKASTTPSKPAAAIKRSVKKKEKKAPAKPAAGQDLEQHPVVERAKRKLKGRVIHKERAAAAGKKKEKG